MKAKLLLIFICISFYSFSQISVGSKNGKNQTKADKAMLDAFKKTKTIFVLSDILEKEVYEQILKDSWSVTDYEVVSYKNFSIENYLDDQYSIAQVSGFDKTMHSNPAGASTGLFTFVEFKIFDNQAILKKLKKLSSEKNLWKKYRVFANHSQQVASFYLYPNDDFIQKTLHSEIKTVVNSMFTENVFLNYQPGFLKNYFQKINNTIEKGETYAMYEKDHLPELENLISNKLYIPSYASVLYNGWKRKDSERDDQVIQNLFATYGFDYEILSDQELSDRIIQKKEAFYYLRYVRTNGERFMQIVNSASGEIIYRNYMKGLSYNLKSKHIADLSDKIQASKKEVGEIVQID